MTIQSFIFSSSNKITETYSSDLEEILIIDFFACDYEMQKKKLKIPKVDTNSPLNMKIRS